MNARWPSAREEKLRELVARGFSFAEIASALATDGMPALSRNAVCGKMSRLGLIIDSATSRARKTAAQKYAGKHRRLDKKKAEEKKPISLRAMLAPKAEDKPPRALRQVPIGATVVRFVDSRNGQCLMFCADQAGALGLVCGAPVAMGKWCASCASIVYARTPAMGRAA